MGGCQDTLRKLSAIDLRPKNLLLLPEGRNAIQSALRDLALLLVVCGPVEKRAEFDGLPEHDDDGIPSSRTIATQLVAERIPETVDENWEHGGSGLEHRVAKPSLRLE